MYGSRLADERSRLSQLSLGDLDVRASFSLSYALLEDDDAGALRALGALFSRTVDAEDVSAALEEDAEPSLEALADAQLLSPGEPGVYTLHELMRLFARERWLADEAPHAREAACSSASPAT